MSPSDAEIDALEQLQEAIENGDLFLLRKLLNQTDLTNYPFAGPEDRTLLHVACSLGERECVVELLKAGADPTKKVQGWSAYDLARKDGEIPANGFNGTRA